MAVSNAQKIAKAKYQQEKRTLIAAEVSKDKGEYYRESAAELNLSLSKLIQNGVEEFIACHNGDKLATLEKPESEKLSAADRKLVEEFNRLPVDTQKAITKLIATINAIKRAD